MIEKYYDVGYKNINKTNQHFMVDKSIIKYIVTAGNLKDNDVVLEIGYGKGALTYELIKHSHVIAIDIVYTDLNIESKNFRQVHGNILEKLGELKSEFGFNKIICNIPFNISEPLMKLFFKTEFNLCILTMGQDFCDLATKKDNRIGILASKLLRIKVLRSVPKKAFIPQPRVNSSILKIERIPRHKLSTIGRLYRDLIFLDNKKIKNALERIMEYETSIKKMTKKALLELLKHNNMTKICDKKIYELSNAEFISLHKFIEKLF